MINRLPPSRNPSPRSTGAHLIKDLAIALGWAVLLGLPLFIVHMLIFDFEHHQHMGDPYSFLQSMADSIPRHPVSLALWLSAIFIATYAVRRTIQQKVMLIRTQEQLTFSHTQALTDGLTGVWNRMGFEQLLEITLTQASQQKETFSIILGDVDGLKDYNDSHGHPAADEALQYIVRVLSAQIRASDAIARYGGDEFAIFCLGLDCNGAGALTNRLEKSLTNAPLSMSFGIATFPDDGVDPKTLIHTADQRMYRSKMEKKMAGDQEHHQLEY